MSDRRWQIDAREVVRSLRARMIDRALIAASPGTGKTRLTTTIIREDLAAGTIECAVVVVPSRHIKSQWKQAFAHEHLKAFDDMDNATLEDHIARGMALFDPARPIFIVTYQQLCAGSAPDVFAVLCARHKVFAVFDEIHHADDQADFGQALLTAFEDAVFKLSLSGTPTTTKGSQLAFCRCEQKVTADGKHVNETVADYSYSYGEALQATGADDDPYVVRPVTFIRWNGQARWTFQSLTDPTRTSERIFDGSRKTDSLTPLLDSDGECLKKMIRAALDELEEVRRHHANAGMLITAQDAEHCDQIANLVTSFGVHDVVEVRYDQPGAHQKIRDFERGKQRVLVAIKMVAEGVDITRLRIGVYASNVLTWMYFMQFVGRFLRWDSTLTAGQFASVFIPEHIVLLEYAKEIERMVLEAAIPDEGTGGDGPGPSSNIVIAKTSDGALHGAIQHGLFYDEQITEEIRSWMRRAGVNISLADALKLWQNVNGQAPSAAAGCSETEPDESRRNDRLVGQIVLHAKRKGRTDLTYEAVQAWANRQVGIPKKDKLTPTAILVQRRQHLQQLLTSILRGTDDAVA